ncbi:PAS domain S-box protein [Marinilabilia sp.]|uniref:PAS domain-containing sensor histidine kinase n=1 Tax=Marinilabilia sp. TaxID=2021252 RepID=UPI0025BA835B|nr:PAS domain S-box protein [Marinilabilia sp.]
MKVVAPNKKRQGRSPKQFIALFLVVTIVLTFIYFTYDKDISFVLLLIIIPVSGFLYDRWFRQAVSLVYHKMEQEKFATFDNMLEGCQIIDRDYRYVYINPAASLQARKNPDELTGRRMFDVFPEIEETEVFQSIQRCMEHQWSHHLSNKFVFPGGTSGWFRLVIEPVPEGVMILSDDITREKNLEKQNKSYLEKISAQVPGALYEFQMDSAGYLLFRFVSEGISKLYPNLTPEKLRKNANLAFEAIHPDDVEEVRQSIQESYEQLSIWDVEFRMIGREGKIYWHQGVASPEKGEGGVVRWYGILQDITHRRKSNEQVVLLSKAVAQSPVATRITDKEGNIIYVNEAFVRHTGYTLAEVKGQNSRILSSGYHSKDYFKDLWETVLSGGDWKNELLNRRKDGELYWESAIISPIINEGEITHFIQVGEDISEKKRTREELVVAKEKAEESDRLKTAFLLNFSHEIRTPMNGILGFLKLLDEPDLDSDTQKEFIALVNQGGQRLLDTVNDIVEISKIESGVRDLKYSKVDIREVLNYHYQFYQPRAKEKELSYRLRLDGLSSEDECLETDRTKLDGILTNLLNNAFKFTESGSIELGCGRENHRFVFYVKDTGPGIPADRFDQIFERFVKADMSLTCGHEGLGLGLSLAKGNVKALDGKIWLSSEVGEGSTFYFSIPGEKVGNEQFSG